MPSIAYSQTLTSDDSLTSTWRYCVVLPASEVIASGSAWRLKFTGPAVGETLFQSVYAGKKGTGPYDFDGSQAQVTVGGQSSFTVGAGQTVFSDPIAGTITAGTAFVIAYDAIGGTGKAYRRATGLSGHTLYYLAGAGGASNGDTTKSGYGSSAGLTAVVSALEVAASVDDFSDPEPEPVSMMTAQDWGIAAIRNNQSYSRGDFIEGVAGHHLHVNLCSMAGSGKDVFLWSIEITADQDTDYTLRALLPQAGWDSIPALCNANFKESAPYATARLYKGFAGSVLGGLHSANTLRGGHKTMIYLPHQPLVMVAPGFVGACLALHSPGVGAAVTFHWQELDEQA